MSGPFLQIVLARLREFAREPEVMFWVYGFPILLALGLGIAFRERPPERIAVDVAANERTAEALSVLSGDPRFLAAPCGAQDETECRDRLRTGKTAVVVEAAPDSGGLIYVFDPTRPDGIVARQAVDDALQRAAGREDVLSIRDSRFDEPGGRYVDFLIPGILGMNLMGGGLWGVGFVLVDMRIRRLLKRLVATPMRKRDFLLAMMTSRMLLLVPEVLLLVLFARWALGVVHHGSWLALVALVVLGAATFSGIGLLVASRAEKLETVSGLMNLVMLPMWLLSGIFFSYERFPEIAHPFIRALPLTQLNDALRAVMLDGVGLGSVLPEIAGLSLYALVTFALAIRWFRWV